MTDERAVAVAEPSQVGVARRLATDLARRAGLDETAVGRVGLAVTEAGTNLVKHGSGGEILLRADDDGVSFLALDRGPGMADLVRAMRDGYSTAGSPGTGLGAIRRQASAFDVYTAHGAGTALAARFARDSRAPDPSAPAVGGLTVPKPREEVSGDAWAVVARGPRWLALVADGLGHGPQAATASGAAIEVLRSHAADRPSAIVARMHEALRATRGAAVGLAEIDRAAGLVRFAGIGNVAGAIVAGGTTRSVVSHHGTLGHDVRRIAEFQYAWPPGALLVLHSDGVATRWTLDAYPGLLGRDPALVAGVLYRDYRRGNDDATVVVVREAT